MQRVSRALEPRIGLRAGLRAELRTEFQGDPLGPPAHCVLYFTAWPVHWVGRGVAKPLVELLVELWQSFVRSFVCRALVELSVLKFVTWILPQLTARAFFLTNQKLAWRGFENWDTQTPESNRPHVPRVNKSIK